MNYNAKYVVRLTEEERDELQGLVRRGKVAAAKRSRAQVLLKADAGLEGSGSTDEQVAQALEVSTRSVNRVRKAYVEEGLSAAIERQPRRTQPRRKLDGAAEAHLVAVACSPPPAGQARWTLRLLSDKLVELQVVESISRECVRQTLKKRSQAVVEAALGVAAAGRPRLCVRDGRRPRRIPASARSTSAAGDARRGQQAVGG